MFFLTFYPNFIFARLYSSRHQDFAAPNLREIMTSRFCPVAKTKCSRRIGVLQYIFWKSRKIVKMMNFEHLRVAKSLEKCILFDKKCLPGENHHETSSPNLQSWPFWITGLIRLDLSNFHPLEEHVVLGKKIPDNFFYN